LIRAQLSNSSISRAQLRRQTPSAAHAATSGAASRA
jgi:hypothetical protein